MEDHSTLEENSAPKHIQAALFHGVQQLQGGAPGKTLLRCKGFAVIVLGPKMAQKYTKIIKN